MQKYLLALFLLLAPSSLSAEWQEATSDHFIVYADGTKDSVRDFAEELERFDRGVRRLRNLPDPAPGMNRVTIYLSSSKDFYGLVDSRTIGGFYDPRVRGSVAFLPREDNGSMKVQQVLFHEYTHHVYAVAWSSLALPGWLSEGLAEFHASAEFRNDGSITIGREPAYREWSLAMLDNKEILRMLTTNSAESGVSVYYSGGWLLTHFLTFDEKRQDQLGKYLIAINSGRPLKEAAIEAFGQLDKLQGDLVRYRRGTSLPAVAVPASDLQIGPIEVRTLSRGEAAMMPVRLRSEAGVTKEEAGGLFEQAKSVAAAYSDDAPVQLSLAEAAYDAGDYTAAKAAAERAIAVNPRLARAHAYKVMALQAVTEPDPGVVRAAIEAGLAANPLDPELLLLSYRSYAASPSMPAIAKNRLLQAYMIAPQARELRLTAAHQLLLDNRPAEARGMLRPLAFNVHESSMTKLARATLDRIEAGDVSGAVKASEAVPEEEDAPAGGEDPDKS